MSFTVIIPARLASTRLPNKPIADICGKPMIVRVAEQALKSGASRVICAVDDELIETWHHPTQPFMDFISFGHNGQPAVERAEETIR